MTGFGQGVAETGGIHFTVEVRSVNNRHLDIRLRLPAAFSGWEADLRRRAQKRVRRGRLEIQVVVELGDEQETRPVIQRPLLDEALRLVDELRGREGFGRAVDPAALLGLSGLFRNETAETEWDESHRDCLLVAFDQALDRHDADRQREGAGLGEELLARFGAMREHTAAIVAGAEAAPARLRDKLLERLKGLAGSVELDPARVAQEAAFLADRCDVTEELVRLDGHLEQTTRLLSTPDGEPVGKRLDFLLQEIHRETNTICSKVAELDLTRSALAIKLEGEKAREQVQNLE